MSANLAAPAAGPTLSPATRANLRRRGIVNAVARAVIWLLAVLAIVPLGLVLYFVAIRGYRVMLDTDFFLHTTRPVGVPGGGIAQAIIGTITLVGIACLLAIPPGLITGIFVAQNPDHRWADLVKLATDVLSGMPSIALGLFAWTLLVAPLKHFSALSGSVALAVLMLPLIIRGTENAISLVPTGLLESALALGVPVWRATLQVVLPAALSGVVTGILLAIARAAGESAPILFTAFGNNLINLDPRLPVSALPLIVYRNALTPYAELQDQAWGAALTLVLLILAINIVSRLILRRQLRFAGAAR